MYATRIVLVVEDQAVIRLGMVDALCAAGFMPWEAGDAHEALQLLEADHDRILAVFSDVRMPGTIDGVGLVHYVALHWPTIVLMVATANLQTHLGPLPDGCRYIQKPYEPDAAVTHVRELLAA